MLTRLTIENFRSLESIDVPLAPLTAFVGPNGTGKTSILRSLSYLFGEAWPSMRTFRVPQDFTQFETSRSIQITGRFDPAFVHQDTLGKSYEIVALRLTCQPYKRKGKRGNVGDLHVDLEPLDAEGETPTVAVSPLRKGAPPMFRPLSATGDLRDHTKVLFIDHRRNLAQHLPHLRGSILGRLLERARKDFDRHSDFRDAYNAALDILRTGAVLEIEKKIEETAKRMLGFLGRRASENLDIRFGFADPSNPFNSLRLEYLEEGRPVPGEELGLGIQSALVVGIFEALRQIAGGIQTVVIEEPEMYLHPQAQRYFYRLLCEMADSGTCQIIYGTHSPIFADANRFESLRLVRRSTGQTSSISYVNSSVTPILAQERERQKLAARFDPTRNEMLFSTRTLLVEGHADRAAALMVAEKLQKDVDAEGVAIVDSGGKTALPMLIRVCKALEIPHVVLHDEDLWPVVGSPDAPRQEEENKKQTELNKRISDAMGTDKGLHVAKPTLETMLGIGRTAKDKPLRVVQKLQSMDVESIPAPLLQATTEVLV